MVPALHCSAIEHAHLQLTVRILNPNQWNKADYTSVPWRPGTIFNIVYLKQNGSLVVRSGTPTLFGKVDISGSQ